MGKSKKGGDMNWKKMKLDDVLKNRDGRYKPDDPTIAGLKWIGKINFSGQVFLSDKESNTDMILVKKGDLVISGINVEKGAFAVYSKGEEDILVTIHYSSTGTLLKGMNALNAKVSFFHMI